MSLTGKIILRSSDGVSFEVDDEVALKSQTMEHMIEEGFVDDSIPLPNVTSKILSKVIEYCKKHVEADGTSSIADDLKSWDAKFVKFDQATFFDLILAANYLHIKGLLDLTCQAVADRIIMPKPGEIRKIFKIKDELTPKEAEEVRRENQWDFE